ncbi:hypothetical protein LDVICp092 [lymphocystis disease virus-China]|uniref:Uncharacterized protein n=1 Tax=lymphocystis disease virus-China TaxID=256729 RepID=Q678C0_9VIRU|nr:hypothetical protein LDVICp092 [lymphocystis disease virus-China]AAU10937.1 hypothetical protein [lymphocystis disease virus-China]
MFYIFPFLSALILEFQIVPSYLKKIILSTLNKMNLLKRNHLIKDNEL